MAFLSVTPGSLSVTNEIAKRDFTYVLAKIWTRISCLALMRSATNALGNYRLAACSGYQMLTLVEVLRKLWALPKWV